jgi:hypothetical protein
MNPIEDQTQGQSCACVICVYMMKERYRFRSNQMYISAELYILCIYSFLSLRNLNSRYLQYSYIPVQKPNTNHNRTTKLF